MSVRVLIVAATHVEADVASRIQVPGDMSVSTLITGIGSVATAWSLTKWISSNRLPDLVINIGLAGSFRESIKPGDVLMPVSDCFADSGTETGDGFLTLAEAGLEEPDRFPYSKGRIIADNNLLIKATGILNPVTAITVNTVSGTAGTIERLRMKYDPDIETMEGAAFFYVCRMSDVQFISLRGISNMVEPRDRNKWKIRPALDNLTTKLQEFLLTTV
ncbi:MAG TPA: futalosine hydrolase [Bacteroidales bacterium]|nr:futalosine hydrolase [Bacteroidales bacterium]HPM86615.1 futalosine hydrolase [Bacteroidales bacterium]